MKTINLAGVNDTGIGIGVTGSGQRAQSGEKKEQLKNGSIFGGNINNMTNRIEQKRAQARNQAAKIIMDQFSSDNEITDGLDEMRTRVTEIKREISALNAEKDYYAGEREKLKEVYGITEDSEEHQDLELIRKANKAFKTGDLGDLSKEELERVANMGELTEYQSRSLGYDAITDQFDSMISDYENEMIGLNSGIRSVKREFCKNTGMIKSQKAATSVLEAASKEIIGMLKDDAKKHIDEEMEKLVEAAKEAAKKKEEEEEKLEKIKEEKDEMEDLTEQIQDGTSDQDKMLQEVKTILMEAELLKEDIKGLVVDGTM